MRLVKQSELFKVIIKPVCSDPKSHIDKNRVAGVFYAFHKAFRTVAGCLMAAYPPVLHHNIAGTMEAVLKWDNALLQCGGTCDNLKCRSRFIGIIDAMIPPHLVQILLFFIRFLILTVLLCQHKRLIEIKFRIIHHSKHLTVLRIHNKNTDRIRLFLKVCLLCGLCRKKLNVRIEWQPKIVPGSRFHPLLADIVHLHPACIRRSQNLPVCSLQILIIYRLKSDNSLIIATCKPKNLWRQIIIGIFPFVIFVDFHAIIPICKNTVSGLLIDIAFDLLNGRILLHPLAYPFLRQPQLFYQHSDHRLRIFDLIVNDRDGTYRFVSCKHNAIDIKNFATCRFNPPLSLL